MSRSTVPYAVTVTRRSALDARGAAQDVLSGVPGLHVANRNNPTQDPRIVIRGVGARTAFGVRGVRVLHDGIPLTVADGQTPLDYLDLEAIDRIEVLRGSASSLYGNSAGGVVSFSSPSIERSRADASVLLGFHGFRRTGSRAVARFRDWRFAGGINHTLDEGFRRHARQRATRGNAHARYVFGRSTLDAHLLAFGMPLAENPGTLTAAQMAADRRMAEPLAVARAAGKRVRQTQAGVTYSHRLVAGELSATLFGGARALDNPLNFAVIDLNRTTGGLLLRASRQPTGGSRVTVGADLQLQHDDRHEYENCHDAASVTARCPQPLVERGTVRRTQVERVSSVGLYVSGELLVRDRYRVSGGIRADAITFDVRDRLVTATDPDESGSRTMRAVSPQVGLVALITPRSSVYANLSSAFETPTATELGNKPDGSAGVNNTLAPQKSRTIEVGSKGDLAGVRYDFAAFTTAARDELVPFEIAGGGGRRFFRNAGRTRRRGAEASLATDLGPLAFRWMGSLSDFEFVDFKIGPADFAGKTIPGVPRRFAELSARWTPRPLQVELSGRVVSSMFVDDANSARAAGYEILNVRALGSMRLGRATISPTIAIENLFGREYVGAVSVNAAGGRYFEPAPGRAVVGSLAVRF